MTKRLRRRRAKRKAHSKLPAVKEVSQYPQPLPVSSKEAPVAKSAVAVVEQAEHYRYVVSDLRRTAVIAGALFVILIVLYFLLR